MGYLREFYFPFTLFLSACALGLASIYQGKLWRRAMLIATVLLAALAIIIFIVGDPVRGPLTYLVRPHAKDTFVFHFGTNTARIPFKEVGSGVELSRAFMIANTTNGQQPIYLWIQRSWPFRWRIKVNVSNSDGTPVLQFDDHNIQYIAPNMDVNYDAKALELLGGKYPAFQLVISDDYDIYITAVLDGPNIAIVINERDILIKSHRDLTDNDFPKPIFKHPSYAYQGERE